MLELDGSSLPQPGGRFCSGAGGRVMRPRLVLVLTEFPPRIGGMQTHASYLARRLAERGYPLEVLTYQPVTRLEKLTAQAVDTELPFPVRRVLGRLSHYHNLDLIEEHAKRFGADLVYCSTVFYGELSERLNVPVLSRSVGNDVLRPWIVYPYQPFSRVLSSPYIEEPIYKLFRRLDYPDIVESLYRRRRHELMTKSARQLDCIMANSEFTATLLRDIGVQESRIRLVSGGVDAASFKRLGRGSALRTTLGIPRDRYVLMTACRLVMKKGIDFLLAEMGRIVRQLPDAQLVIVGDGRHRKRFRRLARQSEVADRITFAGRVIHEQIRNYYAMADAFVLASRVQVDPITGLKDAETMGRVLCEANAAGVPVVAAESGGIPSIIRHNDNGLLFQPDNGNSLSDMLGVLRDDPRTVERLVARGRERARKEFDWSVIVAEHERTFADALNGGHPGTTEREGSDESRVALEACRQSA